MSDDGWRARGESVLDRLVDATAVERITISAVALLFAIVVGGVIVLGSGLLASCRNPFLLSPAVGPIPTGEFCYNPIEVYLTIVTGAFGSATNIGLTLRETTLLTFTGLSVAVAFRAGLFNIGTQGQMVLGGLATALVVVYGSAVVPGGAIGAIILIPLGFLAGAVVGGVYGAIPGAMKAYADAHEVITTIMLNFVAAGVAFYLVRNFFDDPSTQTVQTLSVPEFARLSPTIGGSRFSVIALGLALLVAVGIALLYGRTVLGYDLRTSGLQPAAAEYSGVNSKRNVVTSMTLSGALGGIAGSVYVLMVLYRWQTGMPALGFDGIAVSILAGNNPAGVIPAALLFGVLKSGSIAVDFALGVPTELVDVLRGLIILFVAMPEFFRMLGARAGFGTDEVAAVTDGGGGDE